MKEFLFFCSLQVANLQHVADTHSHSQSLDTRPLEAELLCHVSESHATANVSLLACYVSYRLQL